MATLNWPLSVAPLQDGYREQAANNTIRFQPDIGPAQVRRRSTSAPDSISFQLQLSSTDAETLVDFYSSATIGGTERFNITHPRLGTTVEARFLSPPSVAAKDSDAVVYVELEVLP